MARSKRVSPWPAGVGRLLLISTVAACGCTAPVYHLFHYQAPFAAAAQSHKTYFHSQQTGKIIPKHADASYCEPGCFGYEPTCWRPWPVECPGNCPVTETIISEETTTMAEETLTAEPENEPELDVRDATDAPDRVPPDALETDPLIEPPAKRNGDSTLPSPAPAPTDKDAPQAAKGSLPLLVHNNNRDAAALLELRMANDQGWPANGSTSAPGADNAATTTSWAPLDNQRSSRRRGRNTPGAESGAGTTKPFGMEKVTTPAPSPGFIGSRTRAEYATALPQVNHAARYSRALSTRRLSLRGSSRCVPIPGRSDASLFGSEVAAVKVVPEAAMSFRIADLSWESASWVRPPRQTMSDPAATSFDDQGDHATETVAPPRQLDPSPPDEHVERSTIRFR